MPRIKLTTDMGDWSRLPGRVRLAVATLVIGAGLCGAGLGIGRLSVAATLFLAAGFMIAWELLFDRRRRWWPAEPTVPVDPIGCDARRKIGTAFALAMVVVVLVLAGILPL
jgi:hypothetical protein